MHAIHQNTTENINMQTIYSVLHIIYYQVLSKCVASYPLLVAYGLYQQQQIKLLLLYPSQ